MNTKISYEDEDVEKMNKTKRNILINNQIKAHRENKINNSSDFPAISEIEKNSLYYLNSFNIVDNDPTKTNTGRKFANPGYITWDIEQKTWLNVGLEINEEIMNPKMTEPNKTIIEHEAFTNIINLVIEKARSFPDYPAQELIKEAVSLSELYNNQDSRKLTNNIGKSLDELKQKKSPEEFAEILLQVCRILNGKEINE